MELSFRNTMGIETTGKASTTRMAHLLRRLVFPDAEKNRMPQQAAVSPAAVGDLRNYFGLHPAHTSALHC